jgi:hypothetical protein
LLPAALMAKLKLAVIILCGFGLIALAIGSPLQQMRHDLQSLLSFNGETHVP